MKPDSTSITSKTLHLYCTNSIAKVFFIFALFPFVSFGTNSMDSQPHYIFLSIVSFILFATSGGIFKKSIGLLLILTFILITLISMEENFGFIFLRGIGSYLGFFMTLIVSIIYFERYGVPIKTIILANLVYLFAGLLQVFYGGLVLEFLVHSNTSSAVLKDGVMSLTSEHTFFGIVLYFFSWILLVIYDYNPPNKVKVLIVINILSIFILAKSSMVIVFLVASAFVFFIRNLKQKMNPIKILIIPIVLFITLYAFLEIFPGSRFASLLHIGEAGIGLFDRLLAIVHSDHSINDRVLNVVFPYYGIVINNGIPGGLHSFYDSSVILVEHFDGYFWAGLGSHKILSFIGTFIYELGLVGVIFILYMYWFLKDNNNPNRFFELILLFTVLNSGIAVAFSLVPILIAIMYYKKSNPTLKSQNYDSSPD